MMIATPATAPAPAPAATATATATAPVATPVGGTVVVQGVTLSAIFNEGEDSDLQSDGLPSIMKTEVGTEVVGQRKRQALE